MNIKFNKKVIISILFQIGMAAIIFLLSQSLIEDIEVSNSELYIFSMIGMSIFVILIALWRYSTGKLFSPFMLFFYSFIVFQYGQCLLKVFNFDIYLRVFEEYSNNTILKGIVFTIFSTQLFQLGASLSVLREKVNTKDIDDSNHDISAMKLLGWIFLVFSAPIKVYLLIEKTILSLKYGYMNLYNYNGSDTFAIADSSLYSLVSSLFFISFILLIIVYSSDRKKANQVTLLFLIFGAIDLLSGARVTFISIVLTVLCLRAYLFEKINFRSMLRILLTFVALSITIPFIAYFRLEEEKDISGIMQAIKYVQKENPIISTINELGGSMTPLLEVINILPGQIDFKHGQSYVASFSTLVPNVFHFMGPVHPGSEKAHLAEWLMKYVNKDHGLGFSMIAESYYNFGYFGAIVFLLWGYFFGKLLEIRQGEKNPLRLFVVFASLFLLFALPRTESIGFVRNFVYYIVFVMILIKWLSVQLRIEKKRILRKI